MIRALLNERNLPAILQMNDGTPVTRDNWRARRAEMLDLLATWEYGTMPPLCGETTAKEIRKTDSVCGYAWTHTVEITFPTPDGQTFTFPIELTIPQCASAENPLPTFVYISFGEHKYDCQEEIVEQGVILAEFVMTKASLDQADGFVHLLDSHLFDNGQRRADDPGKIGLWAFCASRVLDYLLTLDCVDKTRVGVIGHSRLGKTALWAGANDERFTHIFSNDSGCSGAAITRGKIGELFPRIGSVLWYWFCENMKMISKDVETSESTDFDQHFLLAACAPRKLYVASAEEDTWADPTSEYLGCVAASPVWEMLGEVGFVHPDRLPAAWDRFADGKLAYHLRPGKHYLSRHDWKRYIDWMKR